ncbi:cytochrome P450 family 71 polypeptide [Rhynchospora pubera]|uniref:Cytochrome P450 family 71 polypeptide n=1 Tax=Rhynchospora pubera TaxID=906938 RepID=A0AAV8D5E5_9POAL|nr:cytochrome P450 family 71 polypeptide [Rhynchospora pubera]
MDFLLPYTLIFVSIIILLLSTFLLKQRTGFKNLRLPPGPWPLPIIGNLHCLIGSLPHRALRDLSQQYGSLLLLQLGETPTIIASSIEASKEILTTHDVKFASRPVGPTIHILTGGGKGVGFSSYGEYWRNDPDVFVKELDNIVKLASGSSLVDLYPSSWLLRLISKRLDDAKRCQERVYQFFDSIIGQQRERNSTRGDGVGEDLLSVLLRIHDEDTEQIPLDIDDIKAIITDMFTGGSETMSTTLEWAMTELIQNHRVMRKAQTEVRELLKGCTTVSESDLVRLNYLHLVIKETLRLHPPVPLLVPRQCRETCRILDYDIPKGSTVLVNVWATGRDPKYWEDPEEFKPERFATSNVDFRGTDFQFLPFGSGRRMCPGMSFGLANVELALTTLLYHFDWKLPGNVKPEDVDMSEAPGLPVRKKTPLLLHAVRHEPDSV